LKDKIQIPNSETAVSVYAPALMPHPDGTTDPTQGFRGDFLFVSGCRATCVFGLGGLAHVTTHVTQLVLPHAWQMK
jgi:hypothetical protein